MGYGKRRQGLISDDYMPSLCYRHMLPIVPYLNNDHVAIYPSPHSSRDGVSTREKEK